MAEVDTSSYKLPQTNFLDTAAKFQGLEQGAITLQQSKLKQMNDQFAIANAELATMANDPNITKEQASDRILKLSRTLNLKSDITNHLLAEINGAPKVQPVIQNALVRLMSTQERVNNLYGTPQIYSQGQQDYPVNVSPLKGMQPMGLPIQKQIPPTQEVIDPRTNQPTLQGPTSPVTPPGTVAGPGMRLPVAPQDSINLTGPGKTITGVEVVDKPTANQVVQNRFPAPSGPATGYTPLFEEGKKAYTADQLASSAKMLAAKPAIQALPLMQTEGFMSGPLTDQFTKIVAGLKSTGLINIADDADPTAIRQEVAKKLYQYVSNSPVGQRSDAAQTLREASSPNPNVQILPALIKLTKDAIALDRIEAAMPNAFRGQNFEGYLKHKGTFPQSVDEKAFTLDLEPPEKSAKLVDSMAKKLQSNNSRERSEAEKFFKSLRIAKDQGFYQ